MGSRLSRPLMLGLTLAALAFGGVVYAQLAARAAASGGGAVDISFVQELGRRWLATGSMYAPYQIAGPYDAVSTPVPGLYPPAAGPLFAALSAVPNPLLVALWYAVPAVVAARCATLWRPAPWAWAAAAWCLALPTTAALLINGGTAIWVAAAVALSLSGVRWASALVLLKPTFLPLAPIGARSRWWWAACALLAALTLAGPWRDYISAIANVRGADYQLWSVPLVAMPVVARLGASSGRSRPGNDDRAT